MGRSAAKEVPEMSATLVRAAVALTATIPLLVGSVDAAPGDLSLREFTVSHDAMCEITEQWADEVLARHPEGAWAPLELRPTDAQLAAMGLPPADVLASRRYPEPTLVTRDGRFAPVETSALEEAVQEPVLAAYAGTGCLGIRPGAWLLIIEDGGISLCSMAHVYGSPGSYDISTAGHCADRGSTASVIAAIGNRGDLFGPVVLDFGTFTSSVDGGLGKDWAMIDIRPEYQELVTPTMCVWGGPRGIFEKEGGTVTVNWNSGEIAVNPDPALVQAVVHYGHGLAVGTGGTPRAGAAIHWDDTHFMFSGAVTPGDSGSGANTALGDTVGATMEAAGIITHIYVDPLMREGVGILGGTRTTAVPGTMANGQIVPYPVPFPGGP